MLGGPGMHNHTDATRGGWAPGISYTIAEGRRFKLPANSGLFCRSTTTHNGNRRRNRLVGIYFAEKIQQKQMYSSRSSTWYLYDSGERPRHRVDRSSPWPIIPMHVWLVEPPWTFLANDAVEMKAVGQESELPDSTSTTGT